MNPCDRHQRNIQVRFNVDDHPCLKETQQIFQFDPMINYEELLNYVEHHITCNEKPFLHKKVGRLVCLYKSPWDLCDHSKFYVDDNEEEKYEPRRNDDRLNTHNYQTLIMWRANID